MKLDKLADNERAVIVEFFKMVEIFVIVLGAVAIATLFR
jgi:hypothetical protein